MDESDFECSICLSTLQPPIRTTLCGHNFCEACLINASQGKPNWKCPECRRLHECPVEFYARNYLIEKLAGKIYAKNSNGVTVGRKQKIWISIDATNRSRNSWSGEYTLYSILKNKYPTWKRNDIILAYNDPLPDWVFTTEDSYLRHKERQSFISTFYIRSPEIYKLETLSETWYEAAKEGGWSDRARIKIFDSKDAYEKYIGKQ